MSDVGLKTLRGGGVTPWGRFGISTGAVLAVLAGVWFLGVWLDLTKAKGGTLGAYGHELLLDVGLAITLAVSLNLILGITGQFSLGHAGFLGAGAFTSAVLAGNYFEPQLKFWMYGWPHLGVSAAFMMIMLTGILAGAFVAAVLGLLVGLPTLRLRGDYLAIATLGFSQIFVSIVPQVNFTYGDNKTFSLGGPTGMSLTSLRNEWVFSQEDPSAGLAGEVAKYMEGTQYFVGVFGVFGLAVLAIYIVHNLKYSTGGRALLAIREDPIASEAVGIPTTRYKVAVFVIGAALAGAAGGLLSHHKTLVNPEGFSFMSSSYTGSITLVAMVILGGQGSITGSVLAAIVLTVVPEILRQGQGWVVGWMTPRWPENAAWVKGLNIDQWRMVIYSLVIVLMMLFRPNGIFGRYEITDFFQWAFKKNRGRGFEILDVKAKKGDLKVENAAGVASRQADGRELLSVKDVTMQFGGLKAVDSFSLSMKSGELVGLIGPNGAGKTTVFNVLTGVYKPTLGTIAVAGKIVNGKKPHQICSLGAARTFQNIRLFGRLTVLDNVQIAMHMHSKRGIPSAVFRIPGYFKEEAESRAAALELLAMFGLEHEAGECASSLSYGDQRRLEIARALATRPTLLLLDEPAAGMNPTEKRELMELIRSVREKFGVAVLIIEHDMKVIMGICERILVLDYGKTIAEGVPDEIRKHPAVIAAYLGK